MKSVLQLGGDIECLHDPGLPSLVPSQVSTGGEHVYYIILPIGLLVCL